MAPTAESVRLAKVFDGISTERRMTIRVLSPSPCWSAIIESHLGGSFPV